ncbi:hypothetical protein NHQ30_005573 [Ciborinia camelliae]|nr:hypothetical protein NHQ30_005573 [Ciborinia camelliae]
MVARATVDDDGDDGYENVAANQKPKKQKIASNTNGNRPRKNSAATTSNKRIETEKPDEAQYTMKEDANKDVAAKELAAKNHSSQSGKSTAAIIAENDAMIERLLKTLEKRSPEDEAIAQEQWWWNRLDHTMREYGHLGKNAKEIIAAQQAQIRILDAEYESRLPTKI